MQDLPQPRHSPALVREGVTLIGVDNVEARVVDHTSKRLDVVAPHMEALLRKCQIVPLFDRKHI